MYMGNTQEPRWTISEPSETNAVWFRQNKQLVCIGDSGLLFMFEPSTGDIVRADPMYGIPSCRPIQFGVSLCVATKRPGEITGHLFCPFINGQRTHLRWHLNGQVQALAVGHSTDTLWALLDVAGESVLQLIEVRTGRVQKHFRLSGFDTQGGLAVSDLCVIAYDRNGQYVCIPRDAEPIPGIQPGPFVGSTPVQCSEELFFVLGRQFTVHSSRYGRTLGRLTIDANRVREWVVHAQGDVYIAFEDCIQAFVLGGHLTRIK